MEHEHILTQISQLLKQARDDFTKVKDSSSLDKLRIKYLGRKSQITKILKDIKGLSTEAKKAVGQNANSFKHEVAQLINVKNLDLQANEHLAAEKKEKIDVTLPKIFKELGHVHPITQMLWQCEEIFQKMGFEIAYPYEVDDDFHNFETLNMPKEHPARDSWDTFWTEDGQMPITHTSSMQNRVLSSKIPPIRVIVPGRCFRNEATDARHEHTFFQIEGVYVDKAITLADMLGTLKTFFTEFYQKDIDVKFTPDFFPFVEPGGMVSLTCIICDGKGCAVCKQSGWLEVLGCGMIHPKVLSMASIDANVYSGFAWGFGLERLIMLKYKIEDIRNFYSGNLQFIRQF